MNQNNDLKEIYEADVQEVARINLIILGDLSLANTKKTRTKEKVDNLEKIESQARYWRSAIRRFLPVVADVEGNVKILSYLYELGMLETLNQLKNKHREVMKKLYTYIYKNGLQYEIPYEMPYNEDNIVSDSESDNEEIDEKID